MIKNPARNALAFIIAGVVTTTILALALTLPNLTRPAQALYLRYSRNQTISTQISRRTPPHTPLKARLSNPIAPSLPPSPTPSNKANTSPSNSTPSPSPISEPSSPSPSSSSPSPSPVSTPLSQEKVNPTPTPAANTSPSPLPTSSSPSPSPLATDDSVKTFIMNAINDYRRSLGLSEVTSDPYTCEFARTRAQEITTSFDHDGFDSRVKSKTLPYPSYSLVTENIARTSDYKNVVSNWINSSGHAANMRADTPHVCVERVDNYYAYEGWKP